MAAWGREDDVDNDNYNTLPQPEEAVDSVTQAIMTVLRHSSNPAFISACLTRLQV